MTTTKELAELFKYVFMDIVNYSHNRSVEAQVDIIGVLNEIVKSEVSEQNIGSVLYFSTGDGLCVAIASAEASYNSHIELAVGVLRRLSEYNDSCADPVRSFELRIGLNENVDNVIIDINGSNNVAGSGINLARVIMDLAEGSQILVSESVHETLRSREQYMNQFKAFSANAKHDAKINVYQYIQPYEFINTGPPSSLVRPKAPPKRLSRYEGYYFAYSWCLRERLLKLDLRGQTSYSIVVMLHMLSEDALDREESSVGRRASTRIYTESEKLEDRIAYYNGINFWVIAELAREIAKKFDVFKYFEAPAEGPIFVNKGALSKLKEDQLDIYEDMVV